MAQISLPRANRVTASMLWESALLRKTERWASLKLHVFFKYFNKFFFLYPYISYSVKWLNPRVKQRLRGEQLKYKKLLKVTHFWKNKIKSIADFLPANSIDFQPLQTYLYTLNNSYYVFFIFLDWVKFKKNTFYLELLRRRIKRAKKILLMKTFLGA